MPVFPIPRYVALLVGSAFLALGHAATAQTTADLQTARNHFRTAQRLEKQKNWQSASDELRSALTIKETPGLRYHLAYCQEQLANYSVALADYERAQQLLGEGQKAADVSRLVGPAISRVKAMLGEITISSGDSNRFKVFLDGNAVRLNEPLRVDPGLHRVRAVMDGKEQRHEVVVEAQGQYHVELEAPPPALKLEPLPKRQPPGSIQDSPPQPEASGSLKLPALIAEGLLTAAGLGVGIGFTLRANQASTEADRALADINQKDAARQCSSSLASVQSACGQLADFKQQELDSRQLARAGFITAGVGSALFVATWFLWPEERQASGTAHAPRLQARFDGNGGFMGLSGAF